MAEENWFVIEKKEHFNQKNSRLEPNKNISREVLKLYNDLTCAIKNSDMEEKNIIVDVLNNFFANVGAKLARKFHTLKELSQKAK